MDIDNDHEARIHSELVAARMTKYGFLKPEIKYLPELIREDEHIGGAVYGRYDKGSGVLVATNQRILFLDLSPFAKVSNELSYDMVSGISLSKKKLHAKVDLRTKLGDYNLHLANVRCASHLVNFIETKQIEQKQLSKTPPPHKDAEPGKPCQLSKEAQLFLASNDIATFSSIDQDGTVHGSTVYYAFDELGHIFITTQIGTTKAHDVANYPQVAVTITNTEILRTLQISGFAEFETDKKLSEKIYRHILRPRMHGKDVVMPPLLYMEKGEYIIIRVTPSSFAYHDYK